MVSRRKKQVISLLLIIASILGIFFASRLVEISRKFGPPPNYQYVSDPELVRGWMSVEYISNAFQIPLPVLMEALQLKPGQHRIPIRALEQEITPFESSILVQVKTVIREFQQHTLLPENETL